MRPVLPLADARAFRQQAMFTRAVLAALAAVAIGAAVGVLLVSRSSHSQSLMSLPNSANVVIVLDLSASISSDSYSRIGATLRSLSQTDDRICLVVFSGEAYEALPPGTPAADLAPMVRYFELPKQSAPGFMPSFPANPWARTFTGGTSISSGMELGISIATAQRRPAAVMLVSDLDDDPGDLATLAATSAVARHDRVPIRIVGLNPSPAAMAYFRTIFGHSTPIIEAPTVAPTSLSRQTPFPWALVVLAVVSAIALASREGWAPILDWTAVTVKACCGSAPWRCLSSSRSSLPCWPLTCGRGPFRSSAETRLT